MLLRHARLPFRHICIRRHPQYITPTRRSKGFLANDFRLRPGRGNQASGPPAAPFVSESRSSARASAS